MGEDCVLRPESEAYLEALARRLATCGYTDTKWGSGRYDNPEAALHYVSVSGVRDGEEWTIESPPLEYGHALALETLSAAVDSAFAEFERQRAVAEVSRG